MSMSLKSIRNGSVNPGFVNAEFSQRFMGNDRLCINKISQPGYAPDYVGRIVPLNTVNTLSSPGCFDPAYMIDNENKYVRGSWVNALSPDSVIVLNESPDPNGQHLNYSASEDTLGLNRDRNLIDPIQVTINNADKQYSDEIALACRGNKRNLTRDTICPVAGQ